MQQKIVEKEKAAKEEQLREMAQRARAERGGLVPPSASGSGSAAAAKANMSGALAGYGSGSDDSGSGSESDNDDEAARVRDEMRREKRQEREREMRMNNMGTEQRAKQLARQEHRDISEKVALGLAKPTLSKESMLDSRLFNQQSLSNSFADEDSYNLYDKPLFHGSSAAAAIYKSRGNIEAGDDAAFGGGTEEGIRRTLEQDRFNLGASTFEGAREQEAREGPVMFEKDTAGADVFGVDQFLDAAKRGEKRGLDTNVAGSRKKQQLERAEEE
ncbi:Pre-mRNA-processing protein 45 [Rhizoctonia solani AG-1 IB]|nr:Pre-mRNA-processing protein 45 [Rhizoctonia solani AG-1 IB]